MLKKNLVYQSLYKPILFVGCERLPFTIIVAIGGMVLMNYHTLLVAIMVLIFYCISIVLIRRVNAEDPQFFLCLYRYLRYFEDYYPANEFYPGKNFKLFREWI